MTRLRNSLFLKIYLTVLASLAVVAIAGALLVRLGEDARDTSWNDRRDAFLAAMLPADAHPREHRVVLERLAEAFDADITLYGRRGRPIAAAGRPIPPDRAAQALEGPMHDGAHMLATRLPNGLAVAARLRAPLFPYGRSPLVSLALIAAVIGVAAYPVVRQLTRRLETLRQKVETWGSGALMERVPVNGGDEVAAVATSFNQAADRIERLLAAHRALLANASHELRSPLARLRMAIDLYERSPNEPVKEEIVHSLSELDALVEEILLASRLDHIDNLDRLETVDMLALTAEEGARCDVSVSGDPADVKGDPRLLTRLVRNLMLNALKHGRKPVTARITRRNGEVELRVRDAGDGLSEAEAERVFEPFYRPRGYAESGGGWGLGLALVRQIAERHGGSARYERPEGGGACFVVTLPLAEAERPTGRAPA